MNAIEKILGVFGYVKIEGPKVQPNLAHQEDPGDTEPPHYREDARPEVVVERLEVPVADPNRESAQIQALDVLSAPQGLEMLNFAEPALGIVGGRQTVTESDGQFGNTMNFAGSYFRLDFDARWFDILDTLVTYNGDFALAVSNIVELAATKFNISFGKKVPLALQVKVLEFIDAQKELYFEGGSNQLTNALLRQLIVKGAISAEMVPRDSLDGVDYCVMVPHKTIRFKYDTKLRKYYPIQVPTNSLAVSGEIVLNPRTYKYIADVTQDGSPYGLPPFLAAMENAGLDKEMLNSFIAAFRRLGMFGFLSVLLHAPKKMPSEGIEAYEARMEKHLNDTIAQVEKGMDRGFVAGYQDHAEFEMNGKISSFKDATEMFRLNTESKMAGLRSNPALMGRQWTSTETLARVFLFMLGKKVENYQVIVADFWRELILLDLQLNGIILEDFKVKFDSPLIGDEVSKQDARTKEIANQDSLYKQGVISQEQRAKALGYDEADQEEPRFAAPAIAPDPNAKPPIAPKTKDPLKPTAKTKNARKVTIHEEFDYGDCACGGEGHESIAFAKNVPLQSLVDDYLAGLGEAYSKTVAKVSRKVAKALGQMSSPTLYDVQQVMLETLLDTFAADFTPAQLKLVEKYIADIYKASKNPMTLNGWPKNAKSPTFGLLDIRAIEYFKNSDGFYLGKFIQDQSTIKKLNSFIEQKFLSDDLPFKDKKLVADLFKSEFGDVMKLEDWKIFRIVSTTVARIRNVAAIGMMHEAGIIEYEVMGVSDRLQCKYCANMQGKRFKVVVAQSQAEMLTASDPADVRNIMPFITSVFKKPDDMKDLTGDQLAAAGVALPPYHGHCREVVVVVS